RLKVPIVVVVVGEGGSGGALAIGIGDRILMMENAVYSVISPEGCAAILWKDAAQASTAAGSLRLTAKDLNGFGLIDEVIPEPESWAISDDAAAQTSDDNFTQIGKILSSALTRHLTELSKEPPNELVRRRYEKFRKMGMWV